MAEPASFAFSGLRSDQVVKIRETSGWNELDKSGDLPVWRAIKDLFRDFRVNRVVRVLRCL